MIVKDNSKEDNFEIIDGNTNSIVKDLDTGLYKISTVIEPFGGVKVFAEKYKNLGRKIANTGIFQTINHYLSDYFTKSMAEARKIMHNQNKLNLLFTGEPGTGKTYYALAVAEKLVKENNGICLIFSSEPRIFIPDIIDKVRENSPDRFVMIIFDEFDKYPSVEYMTKNTSLLSFLDGADSKDNCVLIATVNDCTKLPPLVLDRPGRFERVFNFTTGDPDIVKELITSIIPEKYRSKIDVNDIHEELEKNGKFSMDYIRVLVRNAIAECIEEEDTGIYREFSRIFDKYSTCDFTQQSNEHPSGINIEEIEIECDDNEYC